MVQSEFNLIFWFVSYNIFLVCWISGARRLHILSPLSRMLSALHARGSTWLIAHLLYPGKYSGWTTIPEGIAGWLYRTRCRQSELRYLSCVTVSFYMEREYLRIDGRHIPPHLVNMAALHLGIIALGKNIIVSPWQNRLVQCTGWPERSKAEIGPHMFGRFWNACTRTTLGELN
jgi:hypothetical protein